jgi:hypothetical protein
MSKRDSREESYPGEEYSGEPLAEEQPNPGAENGEAPAGEPPVPEPENSGPPPGEPPDPGGGDGSNTAAAEKHFTAEELAKKLKTPASVSAAVREIKKWAAGKKVTEAEFKAAADAFLGAPIGGVKTPPENKEQK